MGYYPFLMYGGPRRLPDRYIIKPRSGENRGKKRAAPVVTGENGAAGGVV